MRSNIKSGGSSMSSAVASVSAPISRSQSAPSISLYSPSAFTPSTKPRRSRYGTLPLFRMLMRNGPHGQALTHAGDAHERPGKRILILLQKYYGGQKWASSKRHGGVLCRRGAHQRVREKSINRIARSARSPPLPRFQLDRSSERSA